MKDKKAESLGIKRYIQYVRQRVKLLRIGCVNSSTNQIRYFEALGKGIDEYANTHKLYIKYVVGKLTYDEIKDLLGEPERQVFRYLERQRKLLIDYIQEKEIEYFDKFPFDDSVFIDEEVDRER